MDHHEQHHQHKEKEREHEKAEWKQHNRELSGKRQGIHPTWYIVVGVVLVGTAVLIWTFFIW